MSLPHILVLPGLPELAAEQLKAGAWVLHPPQAVGSPPAGAPIVGLVASGGTAVPNSLIDALSDLKIIAVHGVGYDRVDVAHARSRGVVVTNTPDVLSADVADLALALTLSTLRRLPAAERWLRAGDWAAGGKFPLARSATGLRYGVLGLGRIGREIARRLEPFAGELAYHSRKPVADVAWRHAPDPVALAASVDVLIVAVPGGPATKGLVDARVLEALGPDGVLINIARGEVVDEEALIAALAEGRLGGAGLDVFAREPNVPQALLDSDRCVLAPHIGSATVEARTAMAALMIANLEAALAGEAAPTPVA
ncbi:2-hydroxyacid dehydrogenase [Brevundimonas goettingensis]|uniref:2-hydroxyacid dehydrogenase n=1 Tax=Brevundimonas goettingensis TaxID=2774190 RepID=A0A975GVH9_9CAUL|nr:2-hydroxyacid dehydrogenase [Brevundimonas goettingensis]QTC90653.1 2-hydroxyacid dehydrogenase [Brevundimonas goettingensis]